MCIGITFLEPRLKAGVFLDNKYGAIFRWPRFLEAHCPADDRGSDKKALSPLPNPLRIAMIGVVIFAGIFSACRNTAVRRNRGRF